MDGEQRPIPTATPPPGWYRDPYGAARLRWWDGRNWTAATDAGGSGKPKLHRLTSVGIALIAWGLGGVVLLMLNTYDPSGQTKEPAWFSAVAAIGFVVAAVGVALTIAGAIRRDRH